MPRVREAEGLGVYICDKCGELFDIFTAGYIGSKDRTKKRCSPHEEMLHICEECEGANACEARVD